MGLHICPIEPPDWSDGNGDEGNCRTCGGTGSITPSDMDDHEEPCPTCDGAGWVDEDPEPEPDMRQLDE